MIDIFLSKLHSLNHSFSQLCDNDEIDLAHCWELLKSNSNILFTQQIFETFAIQSIKKLAREYSTHPDEFLMHNGNLYQKSLSYYTLFYSLWLISIDFNLDKKRLENIVNSIVTGTIGYRFLDLYFDQSCLQEKQVLFAMILIQSHEKMLLNTFGTNYENINLLELAKSKYYYTQMKELNTRGYVSAYSEDNIMENGYKFAMIFPTIALALNSTGRSGLIDDYRRVFYSSCAIIQLLDDLADLEEDIAHKNYTLPMSGYEKILSEMSPGDATRFICSNAEQMSKISMTCQYLLDDTENHIKKLEDHFIQIYFCLFKNWVNKFFCKDYARGLTFS